jgi:hypothetical protein
MRFVRVLTAAGMAWAMAVTFSATPTAQGKMTDEDFSKVMKAVGATSGSLRKNIEGQAADGIVADAKKMADLMKTNMTFWTERGNKEAADWAKGAMDAAAAIDKAATAKDMAAVSTEAKTLNSSCATCHMKNRERAADGTYSIKKG